MLGRQFRMETDNYFGENWVLMNGMHIRTWDD